MDGGCAKTNTLLNPEALRLQMSDLANASSFDDAHGSTRVGKTPYISIDPEILKNGLNTNSFSNGSYNGVQLSFSTGQGNGLLAPGVCFN